MTFARAGAITFEKHQVAIAVSRGFFGTHLGVAFHTANEGAQVLHLRFHKDLKSDAFPPEDVCWICSVIDFPPKASAQLVAIFRGLSKKRPHIGYGLNWIAGHGSFGPTGSYKAPKGSDGFTCSTIVTELFRHYGFPLIKEESWKSDPANVAWGEAVCCLLERQHPNEHDHISAVRRNNQGLRVRPEEVAAAADMLYTARPVDFLSASTNSTTVLNCLADTCPPMSDIRDAAAARCIAIYEQRSFSNFPRPS